MNRDGIECIRASLGFGEREEALLREAAPRLVPEVPSWVDAFYARLIVDPVAMSLLRDEATIIRLKRSLNAWFLEMLSLPYDAAYERARAGIGYTHVRIHMPQYLMITAMGGIRRGAAESVARIFAAEPDLGRRVRAALDQALDLELALMLEQYRRRSRELAHASDRDLFTQRVGRRLADATRYAVDAALCYVELLRRATDERDRARWSARIKDALEGIARLGSRATEAVAGTIGPSEVASVADLCERAMSNVSLPAHTSLSLGVEPTGLAVRVHRAPLERAVEELLQSAANRGPGGAVWLNVRAADGGVEVEVTDSGPGWPAGVRDVQAAHDLEDGLGLAYAEHVAELHGGSVHLFTPRDGGAGVRLRLGPARETKEGPDADLVEDSGRVAP